MLGEYEWLCGQVNAEYFDRTIANSYDSGYDYFETTRGKIRLKAISIAKKLHLYGTIKSILKKIRGN